MARRQPEEAGSRNRRRTRKIALTIALGLPTALLLLPTTLILLAGMLPTIVAYLTDRDPEKIAPITVGALNLCGVVPYLLDMWLGTHSTSAALAVLRDPMAWLAMYGAAAMGWAFYLGIPPSVASFIAWSNTRKITKFERQQQELVEEWGSAITGDDMDQRV